MGRALRGADKKADAVSGLVGTDKGALTANLKQNLIAAKNAGVDVKDILASMGFQQESNEAEIKIEDFIDNADLTENFLDSIPLWKSLANGRMVPFKRHKVANEDIATLTVVSELNPRDKEILSRIDVEDIICTFTDSKGQDSTEFAFGYWTTDDQGNKVIAVFDGSRRRLALIEDGRTNL
ncbi:hypothetical protein JCM19233_5654 [Vibrio astriarenae]|nr:hypothetical protein JCM19233_5654 [Vibrio sp. C7]